MTCFTLVHVTVTAKHSYMFTESRGLTSICQSLSSITAFNTFNFRVQVKTILGTALTTLILS